LKKPLVTIASNNPVKVEEIEAMLGPLPITVNRQPSHLKVEETGSTYLENAMIKGRNAAIATKQWTIADDSGLEVDELNGAPGIYSARFDKNNQKKLEKILSLLDGNLYRSARFHSVMVLCNPEGEKVAHGEGICWGEILNKPAYKGGEFESILWVREAKCTYGEMSFEQLIKLGSRGKAARAIAPFLLEAFNFK